MRGWFGFCAPAKTIGSRRGSRPAADVPRTDRLPGGVDDLDAAVLGPAILAGLGADRLFLAVADHRDLAARAAVGLHPGRHGIAAALAGGLVVVPAAPVVARRLPAER